jgi:hypothetical protein
MPTHSLCHVSPQSFGAGFATRRFPQKLVPDPGHHLHWRPFPYGPGYDLSTPGQERGPPGMHMHIPQGRPIQAGPPFLMPPRYYGGLSVGGQTGLITHSTGPVACKGLLVPGPSSQCCNHGDTLAHDPSSVVALRPKPWAGFTPPPAIAGPHGHNGCQTSGLGVLRSRQSKHPPPGNLDNPGACSPHQYPGVESNSPDAFGPGTSDSGQVHSP